MFHLLPLALASLLTATSARTVDLDYAAYQSNLSLDPGSGVTSFLGVRYATAPTGPLRFRAPTAPTHVPGIQNATTPARQCWQAPGLVGSPGAAVLNRFRAGENSTIKSTSRIVESDYTMAVQGEWQQDKRDTDGISDEDCLFLNVHVPTVPKSKALLPVIVYLHGGGYDAGNISLYPTQNFVSLGSGGVIAVSVQYRLGVFGFLAGKEVKEEGDLNAGLLDQNFALQWVQKYISHFGGDPNKVTIWGQSAGAGAVLQHVVAHAGNTQPPLFRAAPANSPFLPFQYQYDDAIPECAIRPTLYAEVVAQCGCAHTSDTLQCLRAAPASALLAADTELGLAGFMGTYTFVPVVDGTFVVERPSVTLNQWGKVNGEALLVTTNSDEGAGFFVFPDALAANNFTLREYITQLFPRLPKASIGAAVELYSDANLGSSAEFAIPPGLHAEDLSYEFSSFAIPPTFTNPAFLTAYRQSFLSIATNLSPNSHSNQSILPAWAGWSGVRPHTEMLFNKTETEAPVVQTFGTDEAVLRRCAFWEEVSAYTAQ